MNEAETRAELIDPALTDAGWGVIEGSRIKREFICPGRILGQGIKQSSKWADYVLIYKNRKIGIVEAKPRDDHYTEGLGQAKEYAERLNVRFTYATNGLKIYQVDMNTGDEGDVNSYPSPDELWKKTFEKENPQREKFDSIPFESKGGKWTARYYQENAINSVLEAISNGKKRVLLTLATGTGKTAVAFQISWKLFKSKWNIINPGSRLPRILFLADRNILADQAFNSFGAFDDDALVRIKPSDIKRKGKVPTNGSVFFTIFQSFMSGPNETPYFGQYPKDYFDFIIIDECHRGGANDQSSWRAIMDYFAPAIQLGLTATPKRDINADTYDYFGDPVSIYSLKEGINDGYLTPFKVKEIESTIDEYKYSKEDKIESGEIDEDREYTEDEINRVIEIQGREEYRVNLFLNMINQNHKTIVFCATQDHALAVRNLINQKSKSSNPNYCHRVTANDGSIGEQHLRDFQDNEKKIPTILTTSQKLSTGVDAPEIRNIVLMRPINSMIEFKQIIGRGTRTFTGKDHFTIFDFVEAHNHFQDPEWDGPPLPPEGTDPIKKPRVCSDCDENPCICERRIANCDQCDSYPCICDNPPKKKIRVVLADSSVREIDSMIKTSFWSPEGKPLTASEFINSLFGEIPKFFKSEKDLIKIWSNPDTRKRLIENLSDAGYSQENLKELRKIIDAEDSDLFDVLAYVAYQSRVITRFDRSIKAKVHLDSYDKQQQDFLNFVLEQYVNEGVKELDKSKLSSILELKYNTISDAEKILGDKVKIRDAFIQFQKHLYENVAV